MDGLGCSQFPNKSFAKNHSKSFGIKNGLTWYMTEWEWLGDAFSPKQAAIKIHIFRFQFDPKLFTLQKLNQGRVVTTGSVNFGDGIVARFGCHSLQHIIWELHQGCTLGRVLPGGLLFFVTWRLWRLARGNWDVFFWLKMVMIEVNLRGYRSRRKLKRKRMAAIRLITEFFHAVLVVCSTYEYKTAAPWDLFVPMCWKLKAPRKLKVGSRYLLLFRGSTQMGNILPKKLDL